MPSDKKDEREAWPQPDHSKLLDLIKELGDAKTLEAIKQLEVDTEKAKKIASSNGDSGLLQDMPETVLDGRLGELCYTHMLAGKRFPIAYAWPAMLAVASVLVPRYSPKQRLNLFVALSGPVHTGKSQAIECSQQLLGVEAPQLMSMLAGSAEALARKCSDAAGEARLFSPDELGHLLDKSHIENASFPYVLNLAFYKSQFELRMGKKEVANFNASLSIVGGVVEDRFDELFSHSSTGGLYDRFLFGACPHKFRFSYFPFEQEARRFDLTTVGVHPDVWVEKEAWLLETPELESRVVEIALRAAAICASFDGKTLLTVRDLAAARELALYEQRIRHYLRPNEGENPEAKIALKFKAYLKRLGGRFCSKRELFHNCGAERVNLTIANRALMALVANDDVYMTPPKERPCMVRWLEEDNENEQKAD